MADAVLPAGHRHAPRVAVQRGNPGAADQRDVARAAPVLAKAPLGTRRPRRCALHGGAVRGACVAQGARPGLRGTDAAARARRRPWAWTRPSRARRGMEQGACRALALADGVGHTLREADGSGGRVTAVKRIRSGRAQTLRASRAHRPPHLVDGTWRSRVHHRPEPGGGGGRRARSAPLVLLVDDEQAIRAICRVNLEGDGFSVLEAKDGAEEAASSREALETALRLQRAADALISARTPEEVLDSVLTEGVRAAEARGGLIATLSDDGEWLDVVASRGYDNRYIEPFRRFPLAGDFPLSEAVRTGEGVFLRSERERDERYPELVGLSQPGHALVCLPLGGEHGPMGGLVFSFSSDQEFPPARRALKLALARQVALALERAYLSVAERALRESLAFLGEATALLTSSLELERTLESLTQLAVPLLADWCAISMLVEETGEIEQLVVAHQDPERKRWAEEMRERSRIIRIDDEFDLTAQVIRTGEPVFLREVPQELLDEAGQRDPNVAEALEHISIHSAVTVPLRSGERSFGALTLVTESRQLEDSEFELAQELAARAAIAVENARLYREAERRAEAALALAYVGDGVVLLDRDGRVRFWNSAAAAITGVREADALGRRPVEVLPAWAEPTQLA